MCDDKIDWTTKIVKALWKYSTFTRKSHCYKIHKTGQNYSPSSHQLINPYFYSNNLKRSRQIRYKHVLITSVEHFPYYAKYLP